jgi:hypothetical protein
LLLKQQHKKTTNSWYEQYHFVGNLGQDLGDGNVFKKDVWGYRKATNYSIAVLIPGCLKDKVSADLRAVLPLTQRVWVPAK